MKGKAQEPSDEEVDAMIESATREVMDRPQKLPNRAERRSQKRGGRFSSYDRSLWRRFTEGSAKR